MFTGLLSVRRPSVPPPVNSYFASRDISVLGGGISMKLGTNIHHVSGNCWEGFQSQRSKVKFTAT